MAEVEEGVEMRDDEEGGFSFEWDVTHDPRNDSQNEAFTWQHATKPDHADGMALDGPDQLSSDILLADEVRPRFLEQEHGAILIVTTALEGADQELASLRLWVTPTRLVSIGTTRALTDSLEPVRHKAQQGGYDSIAALLVDIVDRFNARLNIVIDALEDAVDAAETIVATQEVNDACLNLGRLRVDTADLRRYLVPQTVALKNLIKCHNAELSDFDQRRLAESHDLSLRMVESLNDIRDRAIIINDEIENLRDRQLNKRTYVFTIIATIFLPLSFLTGLLGVNIGGMPAADIESAFWIFTIGCAILIGAQLYIFKRMGLL